MKIEAYLRKNYGNEFKEELTLRRPWDEKKKIMARCFHCKKVLEGAKRPGRAESCPHCGSDVRVCLNCGFYDAKSYNECREPVAERVVDKEKANFCEFFDLGNTQETEKTADPLADLKSLFKS